jgi:hypothetical protein
MAKKIAFVLNKKKESYGSIATGMIAEAKKRGMAIDYLDTGDFDKYTDIIIFHNRPPDLFTKARVHWWMCDLRNPQEFKNNELGGIDQIFLCNKAYMQDNAYAYSCPVQYVPQTGLPEKSKGGEIMHDIVFIGNLVTNRFHANRAEPITFLMKNYNIDVRSGERFTEDSWWLYNQTPISLSINAEAYGFTSNRTYNILSAGGFCLIKDYKGIHEQFEVGTHLVSFTDTKDMIKKIDYYLAHPEERKVIAKAGKEFYMQKHTPEKRMDTMINFVNML